MQPMYLNTSFLLFIIRGADESVSPIKPLGFWLRQAENVPGLETV